MGACLSQLRKRRPGSRARGLRKQSIGESVRRFREILLVGNSTPLSADSSRNLAPRPVTDNGAPHAPRASDASSAPAAGTAAGGAHAAGSNTVVVPNPTSSVISQIAAAATKASGRRSPIRSVSPERSIAGSPARAAHAHAPVPVLVPAPAPAPARKAQQHAPPAAPAPLGKTLKRHTDVDDEENADRATFAPVAFSSAAPHPGSSSTSGRRPPPPPAASVRKLHAGTLSGDDAVARLLALAASKKSEDEAASRASAWANLQVVSADYDDLLEEEAEQAALAAGRIEEVGDEDDMDGLAEDEHRQAVCEDV